MSVSAAAFLISSVLAGDPQANISRANQIGGFLVHEVKSAYQDGTTQIRILVPRELKPGAKLPTIYLLPVEARTQARYGDGLLEAEKHDLHNRHEAIFVAPTFAQLPWYCDHPTELGVRQESYLLNVVLPFVEANYPAETQPDSRLLLGFSKSGWGAWSLLLRHPDTFGKAAAWDAPLMMERPGKYGSGPIFGTKENFEKYRITALLMQRGKSLEGDMRLILMGRGNFHHEHERAHSLMSDLKIPHTYWDGPVRKHDWHSGWVPEAVSLLLDTARRN